MVREAQGQIVKSWLGMLGFPIRFPAQVSQQECPQRCAINQISGDRGRLKIRSG